MPKPKDRKEGPAVELIKASEVLGELEDLSNQLETDSVSFTAFVDAIHSKIAVLRKEINEELASADLGQQINKTAFEDYVKEVNRLVELMSEVNSTVKSLQEKSNQLGNSIGTENL